MGVDDCPEPAGAGVGLAVDGELRARSGEVALGSGMSVEVCDGLQPEINAVKSSGRTALAVHSRRQPIDFGPLSPDLGPPKQPSRA